MRDEIESAMYGIAALFLCAAVLGAGIGIVYRVATFIGGMP